jgi:hypothetical protein
MTEETETGEGDSGSETQSHVHELLNRLRASPSAIAPERTAELIALVDKHKIEIRVSDLGESDFDMGVMYGRILTPMRVYHHLWAAALFFAMIYIERTGGEDPTKNVVELDTPDRQFVWANYVLSCQSFRKGVPCPFPLSAELVTPRKDYVELADELFLEMGAFCLLHEIAHLEAGDSKTNDDGSPLNGADPHQIEFDADKWAYDWILSRWGEYSDDPRVFVKRTLGVIFSFAVIDEFRHHQEHSFSSSHPSAADRILRFLQDYDEEIKANEWGATCLTATYTGFQVVALANNYLYPTTGFSDSVSFVKLVKEEGPRLAAQAEERRRLFDELSAGADGASEEKDDAIEREGV